jgi:hypothetical protein
MRLCLFLPPLILLAFSTAFAQQVPDTTFLPTIANPAYPQGAGPVVMIDGAHNNFHTADGRYLPFAELLRRDGYVVRSHESLFRIDSLREGDILVISNALHERNVEDWSNPVASAFTEEEIDAVSDWVKEGGSLFLIADHMPFPGAAEGLGAAFGFEFNNGFAVDTTRRGAAIFRRSDGSLRNHPITGGEDHGGRIDSVATFTGQAFLSPDDADPLLVFRSSFVSLMPERAWRFENKTPRVSVDGWAQGAVLMYGKGRVAVFGEAAMFTAQLVGDERRPAGMNEPIAAQNMQFLLNIVHWLSGRLESNQPVQHEGKQE